MKISEFCIKRPVFTWVMNILLIVIGLVGYSRLEVRDLPRIEKPLVVVSTSFDGASADIVETQITDRVEDVLAGVEGLDLLLSNTKDGSSNVIVQFLPGYDLQVGMNDVRDKLSGITKMLPDEADAPRITKADPNANATMFISFSDQTRSKMSLTDYVDTYLKPSLEQIEGVGGVQLWGARAYSMRVSPNPQKMAARNVTIQDIVQTLKNENVSVSGGNVESTARDYAIVPNVKLNSVQAFNTLVVKNEQGHVVRLEDVATVSIQPASDRVTVHANGQQAIIAAINTQSTANPVNVSRDVLKFIKQVQPSLPDGMTLDVNYDRAVFIKASIDNVYHTLLEAIVLVVIVVFGFLGSVRGTFIPIVTIPICIIGIFVVLYFMGYSLNNMTLLALVLAIGLVVDDAIVMLENIHRYIEKGYQARQAAFKAAHEIGFAILAMTCTLVAVYAPIGFTQGLTGQVFREFAFALAGAVLISGLVALTLSPMLCSRILTANDHDSAYSQWLEHNMARLRINYMSMLRVVLQHRIKVLFSVAIFAALGFVLLANLKSELAPTEDSGTVLTFIKGPNGASKSYIEAQVAQVEKIFNEVPEKAAYVAVSSVPTHNQGISFLLLKDWAERERTQAEVVNGLRGPLFSIPGAMIFPIEIPPLPTSGNDPIEFVIQYAGSYAELAKVLDNFKQEISKNVNIVGVNVNLNMNSAQFTLKINRELASDLGVPVADIAETISILMGGRNVTEFETGANSYDVLVKLDESFRKDLSQLYNLYVRNKDGEMVALSTLITLDDKVGAENLSHFNRVRSATVKANLTPGYTQGEAIHYFEQTAKRVLPDNATFAWDGQSRDYLESSGAMAFTVLLALAFIYLALSAQFESFRDPLVIMLTVPFSIVGAVLLLWLTGGSNNMYTQIGFVTLIGLITKHGILMTEFANQLKHQGKSRLEAIIEAAGTRLRPILMTTGAMVLGAIPLAMASGAGAYAREQLGWVIVGGMSLGTVFSLVVVPIAYTYLAKKS